MKRMVRTHLGAAFCVAASLTLAGCGGSSSGGPGRDEMWSQFAPEVKTRVDALVAAKDCAGLQKEFDAADANHKRGGGAKFTDLMKYLDSQMRDAGCY